MEIRIVYKDRLNPDDVVVDEDTDWSNDGMDNGYEIGYGVANSGWQHPFIYNARYAILVAGSSDVACANDLVEMNNKLTNYNYLDENIYCYIQNKDVGYKGCNDGWATTDNITGAFQEIGMKITKNDFFYFAEVSHGAAECDHNDGYFLVWEDTWYFGTTGGSGYQQRLSIIFETNIRAYAKSLFVMSSCGCGYAINQLHGENRIIITAASTSDWKAGGDVWHQADDENHWAFIHKGCHYHWCGNKYFPGFVPSMGSVSAPENVYHAFSKGYTAATNNYGKKPYSFEEVPYISHPQLDADGNGSPGEDADKYVAEHTYL